MSRLGKQPIEIPSSVEVTIDGQNVKVKGSKGELALEIHSQVMIEKKDNQILVSVKHPERKEEKALWGLSRKLIANMVDGVVNGFEKQLEINGVGYKAAVQGNKLVLNVGFSHPVDLELPKCIECKVEGKIITVSGIDKQLVGQMAANIKKIRKPEPYKGTGIKYVGEQIRRKAGKAAKATGAGGA